MSKPTSFEEFLAQGAVVHDAYEELMPIIKEFMLGREFDRAQGAVVLGMVITSFYTGEDLRHFIDKLHLLDEYHRKIRAKP